MRDLGILVLAAGKSTRISSVANGRPKPLLEVAGQEIIAHNLSWLRGAGVLEVWVNLHHQPQQICAALGNGDRFGMRIRYSYEEEILGTAGAWKNLVDIMPQTTLVVYGDNIVRLDLIRMREQHRKTGADATVALFDPALTRNTGIGGGRVATDDEGHIVSFHEGGPASSGNYINAGVYLLERDVVNLVDDGFQDFGRDVFPRMISGSNVVAYVLTGSDFCLGLDTPETFAVAENMITAQQVLLA